MRIKLFIFLCTLFSTISYADSRQKLFIIIHGTWAHTMAEEYPWFSPKGDFFQSLEQSALKQNARVLTWQWSGSAHHSERYASAHQLAKLIQSYPVETDIRIVGHSFGTGVAALATHIIANDPCNKHRIEVIYGLGCPVVTDIYLADHALYTPNMDITRYFYNFFSFHDLHQAGFGTFERENFSHNRIANIRAIVDDIPANHYTLHAPTVGKWIPTIHEFILEHCKNNQDTNFDSPMILFFSAEKAPVYEYDHLRETLRRWDKKNHQIFWKSYVRRLALYNPPRFPLSPTNWHPEKFKEFIQYNVQYVTKKLHTYYSYLQERIKNKYA